jgi:hypothetical protein
MGIRDRRANEKMFARPTRLWIRTSDYLHAPGIARGLIMSTDTIIDDIHTFREEYAKRFNNDLKAICDDAWSKQGQGGREVVPAHPKPAKMLSANTNTTWRDNSSLS